MPRPRPLAGHCGQGLLAGGVPSGSGWECVGVGGTLTRAPPPLVEEAGPTSVTAPWVLPPASRPLQGFAVQCCPVSRLAVTASATSLSPRYHLVSQVAPSSFTVVAPHLRPPLRTPLCPCAPSLAGRRHSTARPLGRPRRPRPRPDAPPPPRAAPPRRPVLMLLVSTCSVLSPSAARPSGTLKYGDRHFAPPSC